MMEALNQPSSSGGNSRDKVDIEKTPQNSTNSSFEDENEHNTSVESIDQITNFKGLFERNDAAEKNKFPLENGQDLYDSSNSDEINEIRIKAEVKNNHIESQSRVIDNDTRLSHTNENISERTAENEDSTSYEKKLFSLSENSSHSSLQEIDLETAEKNINDVDIVENKADKISEHKSIKNTNNHRLLCKIELDDSSTESKNSIHNYPKDQHSFLIDEESKNLVESTKEHIKIEDSSLNSLEHNNCSNENSQAEKVISVDKSNGDDDNYRQWELENLNDISRDCDDNTRESGDSNSEEKNLLNDNYKENLLNADKSCDIDDLEFSDDSTGSLSEPVRNTTIHNDANRLSRDDKFEFCENSKSEDKNFETKQKVSKEYRRSCSNGNSRESMEEKSQQHNKDKNDDEVDRANMADIASYERMGVRKPSNDIDNEYVQKQSEKTEYMKNESIFSENSNSSQNSENSQVSHSTPKVTHKVNGDHKMLQKTENISKIVSHQNNTVYNTINDIKDNDADEISIDSFNEESVEYFENTNQNTETDDEDSMSKYSDESNESLHNFDESSEEDDDASHSSEASSYSSTESSSSHQLVIDQQIDDMDSESAQAISATNQFQVKMKDVSNGTTTPIRLTFKRRLSSDSSNEDMEKQSKKQHMTEHVRDEAIDLTCNNRYKVDDILASSQPTDLSQESTNGNISPSKSILLQQLEKPFVESSVSWRRKRGHPPHPPHPPHSSISAFPPTLTPSSSAENTKYYCFKCKTGTYNSLAELCAHQKTCLANVSLLPRMNKPIFSKQMTSLKKVETVRKPLTERLYKCSICKSFHLYWSICLHMQEKHRKHFCIYCSKFFGNAEKLSMHLENKHDLEQNHFSSQDALRQSIPHHDGKPLEERLLICCTCQYVFMDKDSFSEHDCAQYQKPCDMCEKVGHNSTRCQAYPLVKRYLRKIANSNSNSPQSHNSLSPPLPRPAITNTTAFASTSTSTSVPVSDSVIISSITSTNTTTTILSTTESAQSSIHCDINPITAPHSLISSPSHNLEERRSSDSEKNSVLLIDESCATDDANNSTNSDQQVSVNESMEQQGTPPNAADESVAETTDNQLVVPKIKLRVPKEFQKSVDSVISSTDSEEDDEITETSENLFENSSIKDTSEMGENSQHSSLIENSSVFMDYNSTNLSENDVKSQDELEKRSFLPDEDDSPDETNAQLIRLQHEIERTKLNIERKKQKRQLRKQAIQREMESPPCTSAVLGEAHWVPTPPISPNSSQKQAIITEPATQNSQITNELPPPQQLTPPFRLQERRSSKGSDIMDIDETITDLPAENPTADASKIQQSAETNKEDMDVLNTSNSLEPCLSPASTLKADTQDIEIKENKDSPLCFSADSVESAEAQEIDVCNNKDDDQIATQEPQNMLPVDAIELANEDIVPVELKLNDPLNKIDAINFMRTCLSAVHRICLYCNYARRIAVNGKSLILHMLAQHRYTAVVDSITAEELKTEKIVEKLKSLIPTLEKEYFNHSSYCTYGNGQYKNPFNELLFECFQCRFETSTHKELYLHNRKHHNRAAILCFMCRSNFFSFSEILCHICPGAPNIVPPYELTYRCSLCDLDNIPSSFRLIVHLRKKHSTCDVCMEDCRDQSKLSAHVWKHKLNHFCYRCNISYRSKMDITKHLFWKHGTESTICKRCLQKRWAHVYHFCTPPVNFTCEICAMHFTKAVYLKVHRRIHLNDFPHSCVDETCEEKFVSRRLMLKHADIHREPPLETAEESQQIINPTIKSEETNPVENKIPAAEENKPSGAEILPPSPKTPEAVKDEKTDTVSASVSKPATENTKEEVTTRKKKKKVKRSKESLEDLNLIAPNLSESDSSDDSDVENKSTKFDIDLVPQVMLSPPSEAEDEIKESSISEIAVPETGKVLEIWKNFMDSQHDNEKSAALDTALKRLRNESECSDYGYPDAMQPTHVSASDHDYCLTSSSVIPEKPTFKVPIGTPVKHKPRKSPRKPTRHSDDSSSDSDSSSSSGSSCSCGSNCSCSSNSSSSSSSSSSDDSDSSEASNESTRKRHRKKSERKKSENVSPMKTLETSETVNVENMEGMESTNIVPKTDEPENLIQLPQFYESDLATTESDTDEDFYDANPQKMNSIILAQSRARLLSQTLNPLATMYGPDNNEPTSHYHTDEASFGKKNKVKKRKRERKLTDKSNSYALNTGIAPALVADNMIESQVTTAMMMQPTVSNTQYTPEGTVVVDLATPYYHMQPISTDQLTAQPYSMTNNHTFTMFGLAGQQVQHQPPIPYRTIQQQSHIRESEGSSCSDADAALKRSKRSRRRNKFYGYSSEEENTTNSANKSMHPYQPQSPPQLTWCKDDLPTPSKSVLIKHKTPRPANATANKSSLKRRKSANSADKGPRKRSGKNTSKTLIPTLKIPIQQYNYETPTNTSAPATPYLDTAEEHSQQSQYSHLSQQYVHTSDTSLQALNDDDNSDYSSFEEATQQLQLQCAPKATLEHPPAAPPKPPNEMFHTAQLELPRAPPPPPTPETKAFHHKIPPALLPNPDFATLQYFKANNIRYPIRPPAGARQARDGEAVYCYCRCPYDEVSEMIACDGAKCLIEWFHFECVGIMVAPQGKWFCAECRPQYSEQLYTSAYQSK